MRVDRRLTTGLLSLGLAAALSACSLETATVATIDELAGNGPITVAISPATDTKELRGQVEEWNEEHPDEKVMVRVLADDERTRYQQLTTDLRSSAPDNTVVELDLAYNSEFATKGYLSPLPESQFALDELIPATVRAARTAGRDGHSLYAMPLSVDAPALYYRADLLRPGKQTPPSTMDQLTQLCETLGATTATPGCQALPLKAGDGLANTIASRFTEAGGDIAELGSDEARLAGTITGLVDAINRGTVAPNSTHTSIAENRAAFTQGQLLFLADTSALADLVEQQPERYGVVRTPVVASDGHTLLSARGLGIVSSAAYKGTALDFISFLSEKSAVRSRAIADTNIAPAYRTLYSDTDITQAAYRSVIGHLLDEVTECLTAAGEYPVFLSTLEAFISQALAGEIDPASAATLTNRSLAANHSTS